MEKEEGRLDGDSFLDAYPDFEEYFLALSALTVSKEKAAEE